MNTSSGTYRILSSFMHWSRWLWNDQSPTWMRRVLVLSALVSFILFPFIVALFALNATSAALIIIVNTILIIFSCLAYLGRYINEKLLVSGSAYFERLIERTNWLPLEGIPAGLTPQKLPLDEAFIPLLFHLIELSKPTPNKVSVWELTNQLQVGVNRSWRYTLRRDDKLSISELLQSLTKDQPVAIIQGAPGMGKTTLLTRLALGMARRYLGYQDNLLSDLPTVPLLAPITISLRDYAVAHTKSSDITLQHYLEMSLAQLGIPKEVTALRQYLRDGRCIVMFDGLDEVNDGYLSRQIQRDVVSFIHSFTELKTNDMSTFNRFLITSRIAQASQSAFAYPHYRITPLSEQQIEGFLLNWNLATLRSHPSLVKRKNETSLEDSVIRKATEETKYLLNVINANQGMQDLAQNPLMLILLAILHKNGLRLSRQPTELYRIITKTLLERANTDDMAFMPETLVVRRLGPLAYRMQSEGKRLIAQKDVLESLEYTLKKEDTGIEVSREAEEFLAFILERGLFIEHINNYYSFFHQTFQEYFVARHMLVMLKQDRERGIALLVKDVLNHDDLWHEAFLLAVSYDSTRGVGYSNELIWALYQFSQKERSIQHREHEILLAAECLLGVTPFSVEDDLESQIIKELLRLYGEARQRSDQELCSQIERIIQHLLQSLPQEIYRSSLLNQLYKTLSDEKNQKQQYNVLYLLSAIADDLQSCPPIVFEKLIPPLLALTGLPTAGRYKPDNSITETNDLNSIDLAVSLLTLLGERGPAPHLLLELRHRFERNPESLRSLALASLGSRVLLSPVAVPHEASNYTRYREAVQHWQSLLSKVKDTTLSERGIAACIDIYQILLDCAEQARYPVAILLFNLTTKFSINDEHEWQNNWRSYLLFILEEKTYVDYLQAISIWMLLFPQSHSLKRLGGILLGHYYSQDNRKKLYAQHFFALLSSDIYALQVCSEVQEIRQPSASYELHLHYLQGLLDLRGIQDKLPLPVHRDEAYTSKPEYVLQQSDLQYMQGVIFTCEVANEAIKRLFPYHMSSMPTYWERIDLLTILLGRMLFIEASGEMSKEVEDEIETMANAIVGNLSQPLETDELEAHLNILRHLPARSSNEIKIILRLVEENANKLLQMACAFALKHATPQAPEAWNVLKSGKNSRVEAVRVVVEERLMLQ